MAISRKISKPPAAFTIALAMVIAFTALSPGCTEAQPEFDLQDVMVYISPAEEQGWVVMVPFYNLTHTGPEAENLTLLVTLVGSDPISMNGYTFKPEFTDGLYQPPLNMALTAFGGEDATLRLRLTDNSTVILEESYILGLAVWPMNIWLYRNIYKEPHLLMTVCSVNIVEII